MDEHVRRRWFNIQLILLGVFVFMLVSSIVFGVMSVFIDYEYEEDEPEDEAPWDSEEE